MTDDTDHLLFVLILIAIHVFGEVSYKISYWRTKIKFHKNQTLNTKIRFRDEEHWNTTCHTRERKGMTEPMWRDGGQVFLPPGPQRCPQPQAERGGCWLRSHHLEAEAGKCPGSRVSTGRASLQRRPAGRGEPRNISGQGGRSAAWTRGGEGGTGRGNEATWRGHRACGWGRVSGLYLFQYLFCPSPPPLKTSGWGHEAIWRCPLASDALSLLPLGFLFWSTFIAMSSRSQILSLAISTLSSILFHNFIISTLLFFICRSLIAAFLAKVLCVVTFRNKEQCYSDCFNALFCWFWHPRNSQASLAWAVRLNLLLALPWAPPLHAC